MFRYQFLCHILKALFFIKIAPKIKLFLQTYEKFSNLRRLGAKLPDPKIAPPPNCEFLATRLQVGLNYEDEEDLQLILGANNLIQLEIQTILKKDSQLTWNAEYSHSMR